MQSHPNETLFGFPSARVQELLQRWGFGQGGVELVRDAMGIPERAAQELLHSLIREGYVQKGAERRTFPGWEYELTERGTTLGQASRAMPLRREIVRLRLHELVQRMSQVNADERFFVGIQEAFVAGGYLTNSEQVAALDVHYTTYRKVEGRDEFARLIDRAARASGRRFSGYVDLLLWPEDEVTTFLRSGSPLYRLVTSTERLRDERAPRRVIFRDRAPVPGWREI